MDYLNSFLRLREQLAQEAPYLHFEGIGIYQQEFESPYQFLLPGKTSYRCSIHGEVFPEENYTAVSDVGEIDDMIHIPDTDITENKKFRYRIFMADTQQKASRAVFLFHGFNEKNWDKYFPWAWYIARHTQCAVILFPIAFHMNRTLSIWSDKRKMFALSEKRKKRFPNVVDSSLTNVAISMRLHSKPQRFIWSGLQTYYDIIGFMEQCRAGLHPLISADAVFHILAYSIGCLLAEILKLTNYQHYFDRSKVCFFCGGAVFNRLSPVSRYILDSEANIALYAYMVEHFRKHLDKDPRLRHYIDGPHHEGEVFHAMLDYKVKREYREELFRQASHDLLAITLKKDNVIPPYEVINTLQGALRDIPVPVKICDFPFSYTHETPFPPVEKERERIDESFRKIFQEVCAFFNGQDPKHI